MTSINVQLSIPFPTAREADVAYQVLRVDEEPPRSRIHKTLAVDNDLLKASFTGMEPRKVRVGITSFFDSLVLVTETMDEFDPLKAAQNDC